MSTHHRTSTNHDNGTTLTNGANPMTTTNTANPMTTTNTANPMTTTNTANPMTTTNGADPMTTTNGANPATTTQTPTPPAPILLTPPPQGVSIPQPPPGFVPAGAGIHRGALPRNAELAMLPGAVSELSKSTDYDQIFGVTGIPLAHVVEVFDLARQWSGMHHSSAAWDQYARAQEGIAWAEARPLIETMRVAFALASQANPGVTAKYMNLRSLLGYAKAITHKGRASRLANDKAKAKGEPATHGAAGKRRQRAAEKAAYEAAQKQGAAPVPPPAPPPPGSSAQNPANGAPRA